MKFKIFILSAVLVQLCTLTTVATVRTVSNNPSTLAQFNTIQAAIDVSNDGDTVYVYGSPNTYDSFTILDKKIAVIGPGWSPDKNLPLTANVNGCFIRNSPAGGSPDGSELQGLVFTGQATLSHSAVGGDIGTTDLRIIRCQFNNTVNFTLFSNDILFEGCVFYNVVNFNTGATYQNFLFQNNLFFFSVCCLSFQVNGLTNCVNVRFDHNLFYSSNNSTGNTVAIFVTNCRFLTFTNNIFNQANAGINVSFSTFTNNITNNISLNVANATSNATPWAVNSNVDGGGNVSNQNPQMADQASVTSGSSSPLLNFTIAAGPANNTGTDGKDMGLLFDAVGSLNWSNSRNSRLPRIFSMNITTPTVPQGGSLSVTVDARKSN
ncbi:MAG: hypothetical protein ACOYXT_29955 [Bacteroidota bacterium]